MTKAKLKLIPVKKRSREDFSMESVISSQLEKNKIFHEKIQLELKNYAIAAQEAQKSNLDEASKLLELLDNNIKVK